MDVAEFDKFADEYLADPRPQSQAQRRAAGIFRPLQDRRDPPGLRARADGRSRGRSSISVPASAPRLRICGAPFRTPTSSASTSPSGASPSPNSETQASPASCASTARAHPLAEGAADLVFSACVFHHIEAQEHVGLMREICRVLAPGGALAIFEHNPVNPVTRYIVATCPFDENAVLILAGDLRQRCQAAGFDKVEVAYTGFFPARPGRLAAAGARHEGAARGRAILCSGPCVEQIGLLLRYGVAGLVNTAIGFSAIVALDLGLGLPPAIANAGGYALGFVVGFALNRASVFRSRGAVGATGLRYLVSVVAAFLLNQAVLRAAGLLLGAGRVQHLAAQAVAMGVYTLALFLLRRLRVFRTAEPLGAR